MEVAMCYMMLTLLTLLTWFTLHCFDCDVIRSKKDIAYNGLWEPLL